MGARRKLNIAFINGALLIGAVVGVACKSWSVFIVAAVVLIGGALYCGDVRPRPGRR
jgi:hypothetical protein